MSKTRIGIVGLGMAVTPHVRGILDLADRVEVAGAYSRTEARRQAFASRWPTLPTTGDLDALLDDPSVGAMMLLTTPDSHLELVRRCAAAGKHILMEKPLEISSERAAALVRTCRDAGVRLGICLQHRFRPAGEKLRAILASGRLGEIVGASVYVHIWRPQGYYDEPGRGVKARDGGGVLLTQGIHLLDLFVSLVGQPVEVTGYARTSRVHRMETEDIAAAAMRFANGAIGTLDATTTAFPGAPEHIEVIGEFGSAMLRGTDLSVKFHDGTEDGYVSELAAGGTGADPMAGPYEFHRAVLEDFLNALAEKRDPRVTGEEALKGHRLIDAILRSSETGRPATVVRD